MIRIIFLLIVGIVFSIFIQTSRPIYANDRPLLMQDAAHTLLYDEPSTYGEHGVYLTTLYVGTEPQAISAVIDTGSSNLILASPECSECFRYDASPLFNASSSSSANLEASNIELTYISGSVEEAGRYSDLVGVSPNEQIPTEFGVATQARNVGSVLGLAYSSMAGPLEDPIQPWFDTLVKSKGIPDVFTTVFCGPNSQSNHIVFGGSISDQRAFSYTDITNEKFYTIDVIGVYSDPSFSKEIAAFPMDAMVAVDSGTTILLISNDIQAQIASFISQAAKAANIEVPTGFWSGNLRNIVYGNLSPEQVNKLPDIWISVKQSNNSGETIPLRITPKTYVRTGSNGRQFFGIKSGNGNFMFLGQVFMENYEIMFDRGNKRLGFAQNHCVN